MGGDELAVIWRQDEGVIQTPEIPKPRATWRVVEDLGSIEPWKTYATEARRIRVHGPRPGGGAGVFTIDAICIDSRPYWWISPAE